MADLEEGATESPSSVRDDLLAAVKEVEGDDVPAEASAERTRDEGGRFAATEPKVVRKDALAKLGEKEQEPESHAGPQTNEALPAPAPSQAPLSVAPTAAPPAWSNATKAEWGKLPEAVRSEILKREADVHKGFTKMDEERSFAKQMQQATAPYEALIRASGVSVPQAVSEVLNTAYILRTADPQTKARAIAQVCQQYGVDLNLLAQPQGQVDPQVGALQQQLAQLQNQFVQRQQAERQQVENQVLTSIDAFAQDPKHPHFHAVQAEMGALMQAERAKDLEEAYQMAIWARPDIRSQLLAETTAQQTADTQKRLKAEKARHKGGSVRGGPGGYTPPVTNPNASVRETLEAAFAEARGGL